jgi:glycosyltransferase involved in cell wall biosynthesis
MSECLVSVVIPAFNAERFVEAAVRSIMNQTEKDLEIIVVDDASSDGTARILNHLRLEDMRIKVLTRQCNGGISAALNDGLSVASGQFVARMDADDVALPDRLKSQVNFLLNHPNVGLCGTGKIVIDEDDRVISAPHTISGSDRIKKILSYSSPVAHPTWLIRTSIARTLGGYRKVAPAEDYDFIVRVVKLGWDVENLEIVGIMYRITSSNTASNSALRQRKAFNFVRSLHFSNTQYDEAKFERAICSSKFYSALHQKSESLMKLSYQLKCKKNPLFLIFTLIAVIISPHQAQFMARWLVTKILASRVINGNSNVA